MQLVATKVLAAKVADHANALKAEMSAALDPGDRKVAALDDGTKVGTVTYTNGRASVTVTDDVALTAWVQANYPDEVTTVVAVRPAFRAALLDAAKAAGAAVDVRTGEPLPGVSVRDGEPFLTVKPDADGLHALLHAIRASQLLALESEA